MTGSQLYETFLESNLGVNCRNQSWDWKSIVGTNPVTGSQLYEPILGLEGVNCRNQSWDWKSIVETNPGTGSQL